VNGDSGIPLLAVTESDLVAKQISSVAELLPVILSVTTYADCTELPKDDGIILLPSFFITERDYLLKDTKRKIVVYGYPTELSEMKAEYINIVWPFRRIHLENILMPLIDELSKRNKNGVKKLKSKKFVKEENRVDPPDHKFIGTIMVTDDDELLRNHFKRVLEHEGYNIILSADGKDAWDKINQKKPDLIITDINMPNVNGYQLCNQIKTDQQFCHIPVLVMSTLSFSNDIEKAFEVGADGYIIKPVVEDELISRVQEVFGYIEGSGREIVLVADDSMVTRNLIRNGLRKQGFEVLVASNGAEAYDVLHHADRLPAILIIDYEMPIMNGFELLLKLRKDSRFEDIGKIMISSRDSKQGRNMFKTAGAMTFLAKPFDMDRLLVVVERILAEQRLIKEKSALCQLVADDAMAELTLAARHGKKVSASTEFMTIMFTDIVRFSNISRNLPPDELVNLLNEYFDAMIPPIKQNLGDIDKFIGDAIMARFRDIENSEIQQFRAVKTGLAMLEAIEQFNEKQEDNNKLSMRIGINTGKVVIGAVGASIRRDFTSIGEVVNYAQRMEANAPPNGVLISSATYEKIKNRIRVKKVKAKIKYSGEELAYLVLGLKK
jgi:adenylate cyclase